MSDTIRAAIGIIGIIGGLSGISGALIAWRGRSR